MSAIGFVSPPLPKLSPPCRAPLLLLPLPSASAFCHHPCLHRKNTCSWDSCVAPFSYSTACDSTNPSLAARTTRSFHTDNALFFSPYAPNRIPSLISSLLASSLTSTLHSSFPLPQLLAAPPKRTIPLRFPKHPIVCPLLKILALCAAKPQHIALPPSEPSLSLRLPSSQDPDISSQTFPSSNFTPLHTPQPTAFLTTRQRIAFQTPSTAQRIR